MSPGDCEGSARLGDSLWLPPSPPTIHSETSRELPAAQRRHSAGEQPAQPAPWHPWIPFAVLLEPTPQKNNNNNNNAEHKHVKHVNSNGRLRMAKRMRCPVERFALHFQNVSGNFPWDVKGSFFSPPPFK